VPILWPITEPAIGYGGCAALAFIGRSSSDTRAGFDQPNITGVAGLGTENGTWGAAGMDSRYWMDNQLQTLVEVFGASVNLDFYGSARAASSRTTRALRVRGAPPPPAGA
jgi:hypothetical protein